MALVVTKGITINTITRVGDKGEGGYSVYGEDLPACKTRNRWDPWHGATQDDNVSSALPRQCYITENVYSWLTPKEREDARPRVIGIVANIYRKPGTCPNWPYERSPVYSISTARPMPVADPCTDVSCPDKCVGVDKFDQVCHDGICVRGTLIEPNSEHCGYTPEPTPEPTPDPTPTPTGDTYIIIALMLAGTYIMLRR